MSEEQEKDVPNKPGADDSYSCPICFQDKDEGTTPDGIPFVHAPRSCQHQFCLPCLERLLLGAPQINNNNCFVTTTLGKCPVCRQELSYFDLQRVDGDNGELIYQEDTSIVDDRLKNAIFTETSDWTNEDGVGWASFHFPASSQENVYLQYKDSQHRQVPDAKMHFTKYRYHAPSQTWEGWCTADLQTAIMSLHVLLTFAESFQYVTRGVILQDTEYKDDNGRRQFCLDGSWSATSRDENDLIFVENAAFKDVDDMWYRINTTETHIRVVHAWETGNIRRQIAWDWEKHPYGPRALGSVVEWQGVSDESDTDMWTRQAPPLDGSTLSAGTKHDTIRLGGTSGRTYERLRTTDNDSTTAPHATYHPDTIWGNTFCQALKVGLASYHFVEEKDQDDNTTRKVYVSYEHSQVGQWPALDDGTPIPSRVEFRNVSFPDPHTFRGHICWLETYGTSWQGMIRWEYEMKFDTKFLCIVSGIVHSYTAAEDTARYMARYGRELVYCNAGLFDHFRGQPIPSTINDVESRLREEEADISPKTLAMVKDVIEAAATATPTTRNPIDIPQL